MGQIDMLKNKLRKVFHCRIVVYDNDGRLELCMQWLFLKKRRFVPFDSIRAIYACDDDSGFSLFIFLKNDKKVILTRPFFENQDYAVINWDELIHLLTEKCTGFNQHNLAQAEKLIEVPILCWHSEGPVDDLKLVSEPGIFWERSGEKYTLKEFHELARSSKNAGF